MNYRSSNGGNSPNTPNKIIVHCMAEFLKHEGREVFAPEFINEIGLSAHAYVCPDGRVIRQRGDNQRCWHARRHNTDSLGVEILVPGVHDYGSWLEAIKGDWCNTIQFYSAAGVVVNWKQAHGIPESRVLRHWDVDPERKADPGSGFRWEAFLDLT